MDFFLATLFLILYYVRPHEWSTTIDSLQPISRVVLLSLVVVFYLAARRVQWHPLRVVSEFLATPNDWILLAFTIWILHAATDAGATWSEFYALVAYYIIVQHALTTPRRMENFLWVWLGLITFIATMAVLSMYDMDYFGSNRNTYGMYKGRLSLNLSIFNNPNALAHSVVLILPMIYFLAIWRRALLAKELALLLFAMPVWCLYLTQSKGGYVSGAAGALATQVVGRPKWLQISLILLAYAMGASVLLMLPRMHEMQRVRSDPGVMGRLHAWNFAYQAFETHPNGLGLLKFREHVPALQVDRYLIRHPTHSSYPEVAAELGKNGLYLWLGILYYCLKGLVLAKTVDDQEERIRRLLVCLVVIYMTSSWMTNISYRGTFFIQTGVIAAFIRYTRRRPAMRQDDDDETTPKDTASGDADTKDATEASGPGNAVTEHEPDSDNAGDAPLPSFRTWLTCRLTWRHAAILAADLVLIYALYRAVIRAWLYFMYEWTGL